MQVINIHDAKTQFFKLVQAGSQGDEIVIACAGKPVATLAPIKNEKIIRQPGAMKRKL